MPATAGRVKMPQDNRMSVSDSLRTSEIWQKSIGFDPYAPLQQETSEVGDGDAVNERAKSIFTLARLTGNSSAAIPGSCKKCGQVGHLPFQCRNLIQLKAESENRPQTALGRDEESEEDEEAEVEARRRLGLLSNSSDDEKPRSRKRAASSSNESSSESDTDSSSSDENSRKKAKKRRREKRKRKHRKDFGKNSKKRKSESKDLKRARASLKESRKRRRAD